MAQLLADLNTAPLGTPYSITFETAGSLAFFARNDTPGGTSLWKTDGTALGICKGWTSGWDDSALIPAGAYSSNIYFSISIALPDGLYAC